MVTSPDRPADERRRQWACAPAKRRRREGWTRNLGHRHHLGRRWASRPTFGRGPARARGRHDVFAVAVDEVGVRRQGDELDVAPALVWKDERISNYTQEFVERGETHVEDRYRRLTFGG